MSAAILQFRQKPMKGLAAKLADKPKYFCLSCDQNHFILFADLSIACANCLRVSMNITVKDVNSP